MSNPPSNPEFLAPQANFSALGPSDYEHYQQHDPGPDQPDSSASPHWSGSQFASDHTSPTLGHQSYSSQARSPGARAQYSEDVSPAPERAYTPPDQNEKFIAPTAYNPQYLQGHYRVPSSDPNAVSADQSHKNKPFYKRWPWITASLILVVIIAIAVPCGVVFGTKKHSAPATATATPPPSSPSNSTSTTSAIPQPTGDPNYAIGPELSPYYASKDGAFNGTGIAIAAANPGGDASIFVFYQDFDGVLQFKKSDPANGEAAWVPLYPVNENAPRALNGTPLATAAYVNDTVATWHLFYVDENYRMRQRIATNGSGYLAVWNSGPLDDLNLEVNHADTIGMQVCYWGNFYGDATDTYTDGLNGTAPAVAPETGMHL